MRKIKDRFLYSFNEVPVSELIAIAEKRSTNSPVLCQFHDDGIRDGYVVGDGLNLIL